MKLRFRYNPLIPALGVLIVLGIFGLGAVCIAQNPAPSQTPQKPQVDTPTPKTQAEPLNTNSNSTPAPPPSTPGADQPGSVLVVNSSLVVLPVTVKDKRGNLVADLKRDEFRVFEDNIEQEISFFTADAFPLSLVVLIDNDLRKKDEEQVEPSLRAIVGGMSTYDEAFICRFDQFFHEGQGFTRNQDKLIKELQREQLASRPSTPPAGGPFGSPTINNIPAPGVDPLDSPSLTAIKGQPTKALDDAVYSAAELLKDRPRDRRKVILLISDGQNGAKFNNHSYDETKASLLRYNISVYCIATGSSYFDRKFNRLVNYSHDTGGDIYYGAKSNTFEEFYSRITEEARNQYTLAFAPHGARKVDYHTLEVRVRRPDMTILTRNGYYGGTFATQAPK